MNKKIIAVLAAGTLAVSAAACLISCSVFPSEGLEMTLVNNGTAYTVKGLGTCQTRNIVIPSEYEGKPVTAIADRAFNDSDIQSVTIPDSVQTIGKMAFEGCKSLTSVSLGKGVKKLDSGAFYTCENLKSITLPNSIEELGAYAFSNCESLTRVRIPDNALLKEGTFSGCDRLTKIELGAGNDKYSLKDGNLYSLDGKKLLQYLASNTQTEFVVPDGVTEIDGYAFYDARNLQAVRMGNGVTKLGYRAFDRCINMKEVTLSEGVESIKQATFMWCKSLERVVLPDSVREIGYEAFGNCQALQAVYLGTGMERISDTAFDGCTNFHEVHAPSLQEWCEIYFHNITDNPLWKAGNLYFGEELVTNLVISEEIELSGNPFVGCISLKSVTVYKDEIVSGHFFQCANLERLSVSTDIGISGFRDMNFGNLAHLAFVEGSTPIQELKESLQELKGLKTVVLPKSLVSIGKGVFGKDEWYKYKQLEGVYYCGSAEDWAKVTVAENNERLDEATTYFYSETSPESSGNYWRYVDGVPTAW